MKTATGLTLIAIGAVLAFAVRGHPWFLDLQVCGWIIMVIGVVGLAIPRSGYGWMRRRMVVRRGPGAQPMMATPQSAHPSYIAINPAAVSDVPAAAQPPVSAAQMPPPPPGGEQTYVTTEEVVPDQEAAEEYFQE